MRWCVIFTGTQLAIFGAAIAHDYWGFFLIVAFVASYRP